jgi:hypothetical protein
LNHPAVRELISRSFVFYSSLISTMTRYEPDSFSGVSQAKNGQARRQSACLKQGHNSARRQREAQELTVRSVFSKVAKGNK